jgi:predicted TIM-barrel fold metal-dependent hydrolase
MNIDSHQHFWRYDAVRDSWNTDEKRALQRGFSAAEQSEISGGILRVFAF